MGLKELFQSSAVVLKQDYFQGTFVEDSLLEVVFSVLQGDICSVLCAVHCHDRSSSVTVYKR